MKPREQGWGRRAGLCGAMGIALAARAWALTPEAETPAVRAAPAAKSAGIAAASRAALRAPSGTAPEAPWIAAEWRRNGDAVELARELVVEPGRPVRIALPGGSAVRLEITASSLDTSRMAGGLAVRTGLSGRFGPAVERLTNGVERRYVIAPALPLDAVELAVMGVDRVRVHALVAVSASARLAPAVSLAVVGRAGDAVVLAAPGGQRFLFPVRSIALRSPDEPAPRPTSAFTSLGTGVQAMVFADGTAEISSAVPPRGCWIVTAGELERVLADLRAPEHAARLAAWRARESGAALPARVTDLLELAELRARAFTATDFGTIEVEGLVRQAIAALEAQAERARGGSGDAAVRPGSLAAEQIIATGDRVLLSIEARYGMRVRRVDHGLATLEGCEMALPLAAVPGRKLSVGQRVLMVRRQYGSINGN